MVDAIFVDPVEEQAEKPSLKGQVEAVLFITGKPLTIKEIAETLSIDSDAIEEALVELIQEYSYREESALEIDDSDGYILQVRETYQNVVKRMVPIDMSAATLRTLSAIAIKSPLLQSDLIELRGASAYEHIAELIEKKLVSKRRQGRSYLLNVTPLFHQHFKLAGDKKDLEWLVTAETVQNTFQSMASKFVPTVEDENDDLDS